MKRQLHAIVKVSASAEQLTR